MAEIKPIYINACLIVEGIAFLVDRNENKQLAIDTENEKQKASFTIRGHDLILSVSSFHEKEREQVMMEAVKINNALLIDEVQCA